MSVSKKKLPNAIRHPIEGVREAAAGDGSKEGRGPPARMTASKQPADGSADAPRSRPVGDVIEWTQGAQAWTPVTGALARPAPTSAGTNMAKRQSQARAIVARHATYSAVGGIVPLPIANVASITTIIIRMVKMLSDLYGVPFERDRARAIVVGLVGGTMPSGLAAVTTSTLFYIVPSGALIGLAVSSVTAVACTRSIGRIFIEHFESGATLHDFSATEGN
jgi:uncharacterized protein (DUF697 family)